MEAWRGVGVLRVGVELSAEPTVKPVVKPVVEAMKREVTSKVTGAVKMSANIEKKLPPRPYQQLDRQFSDINTGATDTPRSRSAALLGTSSIQSSSRVTLREPPWLHSTSTSAFESMQPITPFSTLEFSALEQSIWAIDEE